MFDNLIAGMHIQRVLPEILLVCVAFAAILVDVILPRGRSSRGVQLVTLVGLLVVIASAIMKAKDTGQAFGGMMMVDSFTMYFRIVLPAITFLVVAVSEQYIEVARIRIAEYYLMMIFALFGMLLMVMAQDLLILFLGIETMSISLYALVGMSRHRHASNEGALKYFLLGAFTTGFFLYGIALMFGAVGSTNLIDIMVFMQEAGSNVPIIAWAGAGLIFVAFAFKAALVPFHWWSPDAYEGAPTTVTAFMSTAPKAAAFAAMLRVFYVAFGSMAIEWTTIFWWVAVLTMTFGNLLALRQDSVKRMLAFSSITHAGYLIIAVMTFDQIGAAAVLFYMVAYAVMNIGAFLVAIAVNRDENAVDGGYSFDSFNGLGKSRPWLAISMLVFLLALAGIPPTAGFFGKYYIFAAAIKSGFVGLAVIGVLNSAVSVYYYLRLVINMFFREAEGDQGQVSLWSNEMGQVVVVSVLLILLIGLFPDFLLSMAQASVASLL